VQYKRSVIDLVHERTSWRKYARQPIPADKMKQLRAFLDDLPIGPFGTPLRFTIAVATPADPQALKTLGTYGFIRDPAAFIIGAVKTGERDLEDYGYVMQMIILLATELDLGTCWLGGTFNKSAFARRIGKSADETVPAVAALGCRTGARGTMDRFIRWGAGSKNRLPFKNLFASQAANAPLTHAAADAYSLPLEMVRLGPSASNKQPWRMLLGRDRAHLFLLRTPGYNKQYLRIADIQRLDMGIAMCHFELAARELGIMGAWGKAEQAPASPWEKAEYVATWRSEAD